MPEESSKKEENKDDKKMDEEKQVQAFDSEDINILKRYRMGPYVSRIKALEEENKGLIEKINKLSGIKESDTGLALPSSWNLNGDKMLLGEQSLQVANCSKIINPRTQNAKYMITLKQVAKYVVGLGKDVAPTDVEEGIFLTKFNPIFLFSQSHWVHD